MLEGENLDSLCLAIEQTIQGAVTKKNKYNSLNTVPGKTESNDSWTIGLQYTCGFLGRSKWLLFWFRFFMGFVQVFVNVFLTFCLVLIIVGVLSSWDNLKKSFEQLQKTCQISAKSFEKN